MSILQPIQTKTTAATAAIALSGLFFVLTEAPKHASATDIKVYDEADFPKSDLLDFLLSGASNYLDSKKDLAGSARLDQLFKAYDATGNSKGSDKLYKYLEVGRRLTKHPTVGETPTIEATLAAIFKDENIDVPLQILVSLDQTFEKKRASATTQAAAKPTSAPSR
jgi:hypothetical protein